MRRTTTVALVVTVLLALLTAGGAALASTISCTADETRTDNDICWGEAGNDTMNGSPGDDLMNGGPGKDHLNGNDGDDILGGQHFPSTDLSDEDPDPGKDTFMGGRGNDVIFAREVAAKGAPTRDIVNCGEGSADFAVYNKGLDVVNKNCERRAWTDPDQLQGCEVPWDNADVKCIQGNKSANKLVGRDDPDPLKVDLIYGNGGNDTLRTGRGFDGLAGGPGEDTLYGGSGDNGLFGDQNSTSSSCATDTPSACGPDKMYGGGGDDLIDAIDGHVDTISCGGGNDDWVQVDIHDPADPNSPPSDQDVHGKPFTPSDLDRVYDPANAPAGCEDIDDTDEGFFHWWRKSMGKPKKK